MLWTAAFCVLVAEAHIRADTAPLHIRADGNRTELLSESKYTKTTTGEGILSEFKRDECLRDFEQNPSTPRLATKEEMVEAPSVRVLRDLKETAVPPERLHRKAWELVFITRALEANKVLGAGKRGFGFGVGGEPLVAYFAQRGASVIASDVPPDMGDQAKAWGQDKERTADTFDIRGISSRAVIKKNVEVAYVDWNKLLEHPQFPTWEGTFDFVWSSCSVEHVGTIELATAAMLNSLQLLRPGGVAVHTTEFNLGSLDETLTSGGTVIFRKSDIDAFRDQALAKRFEIEPICYDAGTQEEDGYVDAPPYGDGPHLRLELQGYVATCVGLVVRRPA